MSLQTTAIGAFPKPNYVHLPDWFGAESTATTRAANEFEPDRSTDIAVMRGIMEVVADQIGAGVDVPTDGEIRRENYVHYHCRHLAGFDFGRLTERTMRNGSWTAAVPTVVGPVAPMAPFLVDDFATAQAASSRPIKMTMPGPMTIMDSTANAHYADVEELGAALADALAHEIAALVAGGCSQIQVDEPVLARYPDEAIRYGFALLERTISAVPDGVTTTLHMCCGYPDALDHEQYPKADPEVYSVLLPLADESSFDIVSVEDAHRPNRVSVFEALTTKRLALGSAAIARSRIETADEIEARVGAVMEAVPAERLLLAPDCGLGLLDRSTAIGKLAALRRAADRF